VAATWTNSRRFQLQRALNGPRRIEALRREGEEDRLRGCKDHIASTIAGAGVVADIDTGRVAGTAEVGTLATTPACAAGCSPRLVEDRLR